MISKVNVYGLEESIAASKLSYAVDPDDVSPEMTETVKNLGNSPAGSGHDQFLTGIIVQFDLRMSLKAWVEAERYHWFDFVTSQSTMHRIAKFDIDMVVNEYVSDVVVEELNRLKAVYKETHSAEDYLRLLYNVPAGLEYTARMTTNYRQLKTMYYQRRTHKLPEWRLFCEWVETLPKFKELCLHDD